MRAVRLALIIARFRWLRGLVRGTSLLVKTDVYRLRYWPRYLLAAIVCLSCPGIDSAHAEAAVDGGESTFTIPEATSEIPGDDVLEQEGAVIGEIFLAKYDVFDTSQPGENKSLFRLANRLHIETRDDVILNQLVIKRGDKYERRLLDESERILRGNQYLYDAKIIPIHYENGVVDISVATRDTWTLGIGFTASRGGGENKTGFEIDERNLLGTGLKLSLKTVKEVDRDSVMMDFHDPHLGDSWVSLAMRAANSSDGNTFQLIVDRPFYALDTHWAGGFSYLNDKRIDSLYDRGEKITEYEHDVQNYRVYGGWSDGLEGSWVRRWRTGFVYDNHEFAATVDEPIPLLIPEPRKLIYPFISFEMLQDAYEIAENHDQIDRTEDFYLGTHYSAELGYASEGIGSDRNALIYSTRIDSGFGSPTNRMLLASAYLSGRWESGENVNSMLGADLRHYHQQSEKALFFSSVSVAVSKDLDVDNPLLLGGDNGLRGYPLRYQGGTSLGLLTLEQRYYTDWYPFRLFRVGGAIFADVGRTWGEGPLGGENLGWLTDVGFGLRLGSTRSAMGKVIHIDIAFPINAEPTIDRVQFLVTTKQGF